jgi:hypothetical protein
MPSFSHHSESSLFHNQYYSLLFIQEKEARHAGKVGGESVVVHRTYDDFWTFSRTPKRAGAQKRMFENSV